VHPLQWAGILVSLGGVGWFLLAAHSHQSALASDRALTARDLLFGNLLTLAAAALFALYGVTNKRLAPRYSPPELMCYTLLIGTLALAPFGVPALASQQWSHVTWHTWVILPYSVIFPIYLTYSLWNWAIGKRGVGYVTLYSYLVPVLGGVLAAWLLLEPLTPPQGAAAAIVLGGMLAARWGARRIAAQRGGHAGAPDGGAAVVAGEPPAGSRAT
jgi:drug/metabolite transporter (DMT)-like permease